MKTVTLMPVGGDLDVTTGSTLVKGLLARDLQIDMACGGKGLCATCHVYVRQGSDCLTPKTAREERTLALVATADCDSRLACQARVEYDGAVVEVPAGLYVQSLDGFENQVGGKAGYDYLHPITGRVLIPKGKIITRTVFGEFVAAANELKAIRASTI
ncbi:2Fe-2S iron-sulfur cluster-binding protein [soil metagenome]